jgi:hypothetical protein
MASRRGYEVLNITVDIGGGRQDRIIVYDSDEPSLVAREFAQRHNLNQKLELALSKNICDLLKDINKEQLLLSSSFSSKADQSMTDCKNYGEKLYAKGLRHKEQVEANKQLLKMQLEKEVAEKTSFQPVLNDKSRKLAKYAQTRSNHDFRAHSQTYKEPEYTFAPKINEKSAKIAATSNNRIQELYDEAKVKKQRIDEMYQHAKKTEFPFRPNTGRKGETTDLQEVVERLSNSKAGYQKYIEELRAKYEVTRDPETGQEFFKPMIGRNYRYDRTIENIWDSLYKQTPRAMDNPVSYPYAPVHLESKARSDKIILKVKIDRFSEVFNQLNPDASGLITYKNINVHDIDPGILKIITPLLKELEELDQPLNFEEFVDSMENLFKYLSQAERDVFLTKPKKKIEESEVSMKKSVSTCDFNRIYHKQVEQKNTCKAKLEIEREKLKLLELEGCTFRPQTTKFPSNIYSK